MMIQHYMIYLNYNYEQAYMYVQLHVPLIIDFLPIIEDAYWVSIRMDIQYPEVSPEQVN